MRCIFCKKNSSDSISVEHIIPESLGNKSHTLPKGVVCDKCNNYFALKIEKKILELPYFKSLRGRNIIENKKGKIPGIPGFITMSDKEELEIYLNSDKVIEINVQDKDLFERIGKGEFKQLYVPIIEQPPLDNIYISKFLGMIALEALAQRVIKVENWQNDFIDNESLEPLRNFVRFGKGYAFWPYHIRKIYDEKKVIKNNKGDLSSLSQIMNEYDFLIPNRPKIDGEIHIMEDVFFVCAIMGVEYSINLTGKGLGVYFKWLEENNHKSILMMEKNEFHKFYI